MTFDLPKHLGIALDEATLVGFEFTEERRVVAMTFEVLTLPPTSEPAPDDRRRQLVLEPVGRIVASLRNAVWSDRKAVAVPLRLDQLPDTVRSFGGLPVYGADSMFDVGDRDLAAWGDRLSVEWTGGADGRSHSLTVFQEGANRHLDLCVWFDSLRVFDAEYTEIEVSDFQLGGQRWWEALRAGDPRTNGFGIIPLR